MPYYVYDGTAAIGPFEAADLAARPGFSAATLVFPVGATGADAWKPASTFPDLVAALNPGGAPPPSAPKTAEITLTMPAPRKREPDAGEAAPALEPARPAAVSATHDERPGDADLAAAPLAAPSSKTILVVDDDETVRSFIELSAQMQGFQVTTAVNGLDAAEKMKAKPADLIVTDLMMPGQGGYEFLRSLQAHGGPRVPVFVVTGSTLDDSTIAMIRAEANVVEFVAKPIRVPKFVAALHAHLKTAPKA